MSEHTAAANEPLRVLEIGIVPCQTCGKPHDLLELGGHRSTWADPEDGHTYVRMTAEAMQRERDALLAENQQLREREETVRGNLYLYAVGELDASDALEAIREALGRVRDEQE